MEQYDEQRAKPCRSGCPHPDVNLSAKMYSCSMEIFMPTFEKYETSVLCLFMSG